MTRYEAVYNDLWDYFQVLKNDGVISVRKFTHYDCKYLTTSIIKAIELADSGIETGYLNRLIAIQEDQQGFYEDLNERKGRQ